MLHVCERSVFEGAHACVHVCTCGGLRFMLDVLLHGSPLCAFTHGLSWNLDLAILASLLRQLVPESPSLHHVLVEMTGRPPYSPGLGVGLWDQNKCPFSCRTNWVISSAGVLNHYHAFSHGGLWSLLDALIWEKGMMSKCLLYSTPLLDTSVTLPKDFYH